MNRKLFLRNIGMGIGAILASPINDLFSKNIENKNASLLLSSNYSSGNRVKIAGKILDANTLEKISATILFQKKGPISKIKTDSVVSKVYSIESDLGVAFSEKIDFEIVANGYKPFAGQLLVNKNSVKIGTEIWQYNPNFNPENRPNNHKIENGILKANFDFHLVKI